jgi:hypothetical protein
MTEVTVDTLPTLPELALCAIEPPAFDDDAFCVLKITPLSLRLSVSLPDGIKQPSYRCQDRELLREDLRLLGCLKPMEIFLEQLQSGAPKVFYTGNPVDAETLVHFGWEEDVLRRFFQYHNAKG